MVSVAIFSIVLIFAMGAIITIVDANGKARTLTSVMNNVNFSFENVTRSIKTGKNIRINVGSNNCTGGGHSPTYGSITVEAIDLTQANIEQFNRVPITYRLCEINDFGMIERSVSGGPYERLTSPDIDVDTLSFRLYADGNEKAGGIIAPAGQQPRVLVSISGTVEFKKNVSSEFNIQTTVSARDLNLQ